MIYEIVFGTLGTNLDIPCTGLAIVWSMHPRYMHIRVVIQLT